MDGKIMLTYDEMNAAIYSRACDLDPHYATGEAVALWDELNNLSGSVDRYREGKKILEKFTLRFDHRSTCHTFSNGRIPGQDDGVATLRREAGYIAQSQAYDTAIFNVRAK